MLTESNEPKDSWICVAPSLDDARANDLALVLIARGIEHQRQRSPSGWDLWVRLSNAEAAAAELTLYRRENARAIGPRRLEEFGDGWPGVIVYAAALLFVFVALHSSGLSRDWLGAGLLDAAAVRSGDWWRVVTALTLHVELDHLGGNLGFGAFFGFFVGRYLGRGVGWLTVLTAAALANAASAWLEPLPHRSLGASTAVFAALGLLVAYTWRRGYLRETPWRSRIAPIIAGLGLLAFTGTGGENVDLGAHLLGFSMGFASGLGLAAMPLAWFESRRVQAVTALVAVTVVIGSWVVALVRAG